LVSELSENLNSICITPAELYLMLQFDHALWKLCDLFEKFEKEILNKKDMERKMKTFTIIALSIVLGIPRNKMVRMLVESGLYKESYAEKAVRNYVKILAKPYELASYRVRSQTKKTEKGRWGRHEIEKKAGRPPLVFSVEKSFSLINIKMDERLGRLIGFASILSGSFPRLMKILVRMGFKLGILDEIVHCFQEFSKVHDLQPLNLKLEDTDIKKKIEKEIDKYFNLLVEPIRKDALKSIKKCD